MFLKRGILFVAVVFVSLIAIDLPAKGQTEHYQEPDNVHAVEISNLNSAPVMGVLLLRLQEIQAKLDLHQDVAAQKLCASLFYLSIDIRQQFDGYLYTSYLDLSHQQQAAYLSVGQLVIELEQIVAKAEDYEGAISLARELVVTA